MSMERHDPRRMTIDKLMHEMNADQEFTEFARTFPTMRAVWNAMKEGNGKPHWLVLLLRYPGLIQTSTLNHALRQIAGTVPTPGGRTIRNLLTNEVPGRHSDEEEERNIDGEMSSSEFNKGMTTILASADSSEGVVSDDWNHCLQIISCIPNPFED